MPLSCVDLSFVERRLLVSLLSSFVELRLLVKQGWPSMGPRSMAWLEREFFPIFEDSSLGPTAQPINLLDTLLVGFVTQRYNSRDISFKSKG